MKTEKIYGAIAEIIGELKAIKKEKTTTGYASFKYRGIDDCYIALNPLLAKYKVIIAPCFESVISDTEKITKNGAVMRHFTGQFRFDFYHEDGSSFSARTIGEAMDSGDKACNKAMSIAMKYVLFQTFCIPTEDQPDPDAETHEVVKPVSVSQNTNKQVAPQKPSAPSVGNVDWHYVCQFGSKHKGKTIKEIGINAALGYAQWLHGQAQTAQKPLSRDAQDFVNATGFIS